MSTGSIWGQTRRGLVSRNKGGSTKRRRQGLSVIPPTAWPTVAAVLDERDWLGVVVLLSVCYLQGTEVHRVVLDDDVVVVFAQRRTRRFVLPSAEAVSLVERFLARFHEETADMRAATRDTHLSNVLSTAVEPEVRRRLLAAGHRWATALDVSIGSLRRAGIEQLLATNERRELVRAFTRNPRAHPEDLLPPVSVEVMAAFDEAVAPFWTQIGRMLSPTAKAAIAALTNSDANAGDGDGSS